VSRIACVVPAYEVAGDIREVLRGLRVAVPEARLIVVDDGSTDGTAGAAASHADLLVRHSNNLGKGVALRAGINAALSSGAELVVTIDGDGQHAPEALPAMLAAAGEADVVIGSRRRLGTDMPLQRRFSNWLSSQVVSVLSGCRVVDSQSGYRVIRRGVLLAVDPQGDRFELETDFLVRAGRAGFRIVSVPVPTRYGSASHFRAVHDTLRLLRVMLRHAFAPSR
jgi:glycosyltransferase involved in cell wall biosynthesis